MSNPPTDRGRELASTYFVQDRSNEEELIRLQVQDQMVTTGMGGVLSEQPDPAIFQRVLDVACGTGGWLIETAKAYPTISLLAGVDVSARFTEYARTQAEAQHVSDRVQFYTADALRMLEFPDNYFDLVNQRFGQSYARTWDWPKLLSEFQRVAQPGGVIRLTEPESSTVNSSPALTRLCAILGEIGYRAGSSPTPERTGMTNELAPLLKFHGFENVQTREHILEYKGGSAEARLFYEDTKHVFRTVLPFLKKWTHLPDDYETLYEQALRDILQPDFHATWRMVTVWGTKP